MKDLLKVYWKLKLVHYGLFLGMMGGFANFIGPDRDHWIKIAIGVTIGCMLLGARLINALKSLLEWSDKYFKENQES